MIELNRRVYLDEPTGHIHRDYAALDLALTRILPAVASRFYEECS